MSEATAKKLNMHSLAVPRAFFGKERDKKLGSANFVPLNGAARFTASKILALSLMHTESIMFGSLNLMPYSAFTDELYQSRPTVCKNLKELVSEDIINKLRQSKYEIKAEYSDARTITVYSFLLEEKFNLGGLVRRLTGNEVLFVCEMAAFYLNEKNARKHFIGGRRRVAKLLNVPDSTAGYIIDRLIKTKVIFRKTMYKDGAGNEVVNNGKGSSKNDLTVYEVNGEILRRCRAIEEERAKTRTLKKLFGQGGKKKPKKEPSPVPTNTPTAPSHWTFAEQAKKDKAARSLEKIFTDFNKDETVKNIRARYKRAYSAFIAALRSGNEQAQEELEEQLNVIQDELRIYLIKQGAPPDIPQEKLNEYINN